MEEGATIRARGKIKNNNQVSFDTVEASVTSRHKHFSSINTSVIRQDRLFLMLMMMIPIDNAIFDCAVFIKNLNRDSIQQWYLEESCLAFWPYSLAPYVYRQASFCLMMPRQHLLLSQSLPRLTSKTITRAVK